VRSRCPARPRSVDHANASGQWSAGAAVSQRHRHRPGASGTSRADADRPRRHATLRRADCRRPTQQVRTRHARADHTCRRGPTWRRLLLPHELPAVSAAARSAERTAAPGPRADEAEVAGSRPDRRRWGSRPSAPRTPAFDRIVGWEVASTLMGTGPISARCRSGAAVGKTRAMPASRGPGRKVPRRNCAGQAGLVAGQRLAADPVAVLLPPDATGARHQTSAPTGCSSSSISRASRRGRRRRPETPLGQSREPQSV
jgi:hypothetical protein